VTGAEHFPSQSLPSGSGACRPIISAKRAGWDQVAMGEWQLFAEGFGDCHPHDEVTYVLEGTLEVDSQGTRVVAHAGDVVRVPAGIPAYYYAPEYARMLYIYGPNPEGQPAWTFVDRAQVAPKHESEAAGLEAPGPTSGESR